MEPKKVIEKSIFEIRKIYFEQITVDPDRKKYGERVFCYELYHQLRLQEDKLEGHTISGETVKSPFQFSVLEHEKTPDILIHRFGTTANNAVAIEVKTNEKRSTVYNGIWKDLETLDQFTKGEIDYQLGIYLLINHDFWALYERSERFKKAVDHFAVPNPRIGVWNIASPQFTHDKKLAPSCLRCYTNDEIKQRCIA